MISIAGGQAIKWEDGDIKITARVKDSIDKPTERYTIELQIEDLPFPKAVEFFMPEYRQEFISFLAREMHDYLFSYPMHEEHIQFLTDKFMETLPDRVKKG